MKTSQVLRILNNYSIVVKIINNFIDVIIYFKIIKSFKKVRRNNAQSIITTYLIFSIDIKNNEEKFKFTVPIVIIY